MRFRDGFAAADRHSVKHASRLARIFLQRRKERCLKTRPNAPENVQVQFHIIFLIIEYAPTIIADLARDLFDELVCYQENVELRPNPSDRMFIGP